MIELDDTISKILYIDQDITYTILTYTDCSSAFTKEFIMNYVDKMVEQNPILKKTVIEKGGIFYLDDIPNFEVKDYYTIEYTLKDTFENYISDMLNGVFVKESKWKALFLVDKTNNITRIYFKIHHAYTDGYKLIKILTTTSKSYEPITNKFKRNTNNIFKTLYYYFIGTIMLIILNIKIAFKMIWNTFFGYNTVDYSNKKTDFLICKSLPLKKIKEFTKRKNITINDFLYAIMIKTDKLYNDKKRNIITCSPINVSGTEYTNNVCPIFNTVYNSSSNETLLQTINNTFNNCKYSLFIPLCSFFINNIVSMFNLQILSYFYNNTLTNVDYIFSNIVGPPSNIVPIENCSITDIHFLTTAKKSEIVFNIVSSGDNININCSFKKGVIKNKKKFRLCIYEAYNELINT